MRAGVVTPLFLTSLFACDGPGQLPSTRYSATTAPPRVSTCSAASITAPQLRALYSHEHSRRGEMLVRARSRSEVTDRESCVMLI